MSTDTGLGEDFDLGDDTANLFLDNLIGDELKEDDRKKLQGAGKAAPGDDEEDPKVTEEFEKDAADEPEEDEDGEKTDDKAPEEDPEDPEVDLGDSVKAKMSDLKAAFKAQAETTALRTQAEQLRGQAQHEATIAKAVVTKALERAQARWEPFSKVDFLALSKDESIDAATFAALRKEASEALADYKFHSEELSGITAQETEVRNVSAAATVKALSDPTTGIKGWGNEMYRDLMGYAAKLGAPEHITRNITAEWGFRALHKAYLYDKGVAEAEAKIEAVKHKPTRTFATGKGVGKVAPKTAFNSAMSKLSRSGDVDDAADAFFALASED